MLNMLIRSSGLLAVALLAAPSAFAQLAECEAQFHAGQLDAAIASCGATVQSDPENARAWTLRGLAHHAAGRPLQALPDLDRALGIDPRDVAALEVRADIQAAQGDAATALRDLQAAVTARPDDARLLMALAGLQARTGNTDQARATLERAAKADKRNAEPWLRLARLTGDTRKRLDYLSRAVKADKTHVEALKLRAQVYLDSGEVRKAVRDQRAALALKPDDEALRHALASVHLQQKAPRDALAVINEGFAHGPAWKLRELRGHAHLAQGNVIAAYDDLHTLREAGVEMSSALADGVTTALDARYAPGGARAGEALATLVVGPVDCQLSPSDEVMLEALAANGGGVAAAEADLRTRWRATLDQCLAAAAPPPTERFAEVRRVIAEYTAGTLAASQRLEQDCAPYPMREQCALIAAGLREEPAKMMAQLREVEQFASARRIELAGLRSRIDEPVSAAIKASQVQLGASARRHFAAFTEAGERDAALQYFRTATVEDVGATCPVPPQRASDINQPDRANGESRTYFQCLKDVEKRLEAQWEMSRHAESLQRQRHAVDALSEYRCSRRAGSGCVQDAAWARVDAALPKSRVAAAVTLDARRSALLGGGLHGLILARNDYVEGINQRIAQIEAEREREEQARAFAQGLQAIADSLNQPQQGYRRSSSTSAPGMR